MVPSRRGATGVQERAADHHTRRGPMRRLGFVAALLGMLCVIPSAGFAQVRGVYWTTSGKFGPFKISGLIPTIPKDKDRDITIPVSMWVIDHPKGLVVYVTGNNAAVADGKFKDYREEGLCALVMSSISSDDVIGIQ